MLRYYFFTLNKNICFRRIAMLKKNILARLWLPVPDKCILATLSRDVTRISRLHVWTVDDIPCDYCLCIYARTAVTFKSIARHKELGCKFLWLPGLSATLPSHDNQVVSNDWTSGTFSTCRTTFQMYTVYIFCFGTKEKLIWIFYKCSTKMDIRNQNGF